MNLLQNKYSFYINLDERTDRSDLFLQNEGVSRVHRFPAQKGGFAGLNKTMSSLFFGAIKTGMNEVLVFEDDVVFDGNEFWNKADEALADLPEDYDCLHFGLNLLMPPQQLPHTDKIYRITKAYAAHAVLYSRKAMQFLLPLLHKFGETEPFDVILCKYLQPWGNCYCTSEMLAKQRKTTSNIFKYNPNIHIGIEAYYNRETKEIDWQKMMDERFEQLKPTK